MDSMIKTIEKHVDICRQTWANVYPRHLPIQLKWPPGSVSTLDLVNRVIFTGWMSTGAAVRAFRQCGRPEVQI
jgi:hypothetical protein